MTPIEGTDEFVKLVAENMAQEGSIQINIWRGVFEVKRFCHDGREVEVYMRGAGAGAHIGKAMMDAIDAFNASIIPEHPLTSSTVQGDNHPCAALSVPNSSQS